MRFQRVIVRVVAVSALFAVCLPPLGVSAQTAPDGSNLQQLAGPPSSKTHVVGEGESLASIAKAYNLSLDSIKAANPSVSADRLEVGQALLILPADGLIHVAGSNENVKNVAQRYSVKTEVIAKANKLEEDEALTKGQMLFIPASLEATAGSVTDASGKIDPRSYQVQHGDTLWTISKRFGVEPTVLMVDNDIKDPKTVVPGSQLRILPARGVESVVLKENESLSDLAARYHVDLGALLDYNQLDSPEGAKVGARIVIPQTNGGSDGSGQSPSLAKSQVTSFGIPSSELTAGGGDKGQLIATTALKYLGARYVFGGTSPSGFDCSGFAYFVHRSAGVPVGRTLWQQFNSGSRVAKSQLQVGDQVFFANTYMRGLSHAGIYIGDGKFVHANNERTGVVISRLEDEYWATRYVGAARIRA